jgi:all-trans-retinol 13,14-reductase
MYGIIKDINRGAAYRVSHRTKIPNLFLTGQNINSHGALGVLVGTIVTCSELLTAERIYKQIIEANE